MTELFSCVGGRTMRRPNASRPRTKFALVVIAILLGLRFVATVESATVALVAGHGVGPGAQDGCNAANVKNCDGPNSHPNSIGGKPLFEDANLTHLTSSSPGWNQGTNDLATILGFTPFRAHQFDLDGHTRPRDGAYDIGAYEGSGSTGGGGC